MYNTLAFVALRFRSACSIAAFFFLNISEHFTYCISDFCLICPGLWDVNGRSEKHTWKLLAGKRLGSPSSVLILFQGSFLRNEFFFYRKSSLILSVHQLFDNILFFFQRTCSREFACGRRAARFRHFDLNSLEELSCSYNTLIVLIKWYGCFSFGVSFTSSFQNRPYLLQRQSFSHS